MKTEDLERISGYSALAIRMLTESSIPATPQFYELLYTYATGTNPGLNNSINTVLKSGAKPDTDLVSELYRKFMQSSDVDERLGHVSEEIAANIDAVHIALNQAHASANSYSGLLQSASGDLKDGLSNKDLSSLTTNLLSETRNMQSTNTELEDSLGSAKDQISALQEELEKLQLESMLDPLTKIHNRKAFDRAMENCVEEAQSGGNILSLIFVDIDHFKQFNDNFGHQTGDQVLRLVGSTLESHTKETDVAARYGGEEFAVILPGTDLLEASEIAERLRKAIRSRQLHKRSTKENLGKISASFGVALFKEGDTINTLVERADACLYAAKRNGRNQVVEEGQLVELLKKQGTAA